MQSFYGERSRTHLSNGTVHKMHVVLRKSLTQAASDGLIPQEGRGWVVGKTTKSVRGRRVRRT